MVKNFVLDTNVFMSNANALFGYEDNTVILCGTVLQELDKHKTDEGERGYNAREAIRNIRQVVKEAFDNKDKILDFYKQTNPNLLRRFGDDNISRTDLLTKIGIPLNDKGGRLLFEPDGVKIENLPKGYELDRADNKIISSCVEMNKTYCKDNNVILLTEDSAMHLNAEVCGVHAENVKNEQIAYTGYSGHVNVEIVDYNIINRIHKEITIPASDIPEIAKLEYPLFENQFVTITCGNQSALTVYQKDKITKIPDDLTINEYKIKPMNKMQRYAMWALTNPDIPLVILEGPAGTAKTFLSLACGLSMVDTSLAYGKDLSYYGDSGKEQYGRLLISRPNNGNSDADFGYLPGTLEEKMGPLVASYMDNLEEILGGKDSRTLKETRETIEDMMYSRAIELCPLYSIRGRSIHNAFLICDEAQNATKNLIRDVVTRAGKNTKIVVAGDPRQIDNTSLNVHNNGLVYLKDCMKGSSQCAILRFENDNCVRSDLAEEAINRMK